ncbi:unnamed protein product [Rotaria magnacalcarata]|uniref:Sodium-coupled monocarboxylate transporter 1 n=1 Tax=Rotaria magnacalcarata TaxID=392030 RepID=A0A8S2P2F9_9BILA|nr:unnamed protein product [Rotaria magnacalcarata]
MKAVIWTDVSQTILMFLGMILSIVIGVIDAGGVRKVFEIALNGDRIHLLSMSVHPSARYTVWSVLIGGSLYSTSVCACLQTQAQRFMCVKTTRAAQKVAWVNYMLIVAMLFLCAGVGFVLFAKYSHCDPLLAKLISKPDQLYPLFVIQTFSRLPGLTGLFIASILSASLSTISSGINSMATAILEDIYKRILKQSTVTDERQAIMSKVLCSNDPKSIDSSLLASWKDLFGCCYKKKTVGSVVMNGDHLSPEHQQVEEERILQN